ncbi:hypothetical protein ABZ820_29860 [Streptomyces diacarni]|uniref:hypothetical protein n=1 Tax=Streptomyces diacarni TaxID=2800381 RepID=UPI0033F8783B
MPHSRTGAAVRPRPRAAGAVLAAAALCGLTACEASDSSLYAGPGEESSTASPTFSPEKGPSSSPSPSALPPSARHALTALRTARDAVPDSTPYHLVRDHEGTPEWEIKLSAARGSEWTVAVSDDGGTVTDKHEDTRPDDATGRLSGFAVSLPQAVRKTARRLPEQELTEVATEKNTQGTDLWEVSTATGTSAEAEEVHTLIDTETGKVVREKREE